MGDINSNCETSTKVEFLVMLTTRIVISFAALKFRNFLNRSVSCQSWRCLCEIVLNCFLKHTWFIKFLNSFTSPHEKVIFCRQFLRRYSDHKKTTANLNYSRKNSSILSCFLCACGKASYFRTKRVFAGNFKVERILIAK